MREMMQRGKRIYALDGRAKTKKTKAIVMFCMGLFFVIAGIDFSFITMPLAYFLGSAGLVFIGLGWFSYGRMKSLGLNV